MPTQQSKTSNKTISRSQWDAMEYHQHDALVAEHVMGLEWREWKPYYSPEGWFPKDFSGPCMGRDGGTPFGYKQDLPCYTFDWEAMREVVERMATKHLSVCIWEAGPGSLGFGASFKEMPDGLVYHAEARTAPQAAAIAALSALGVFSE